MQNRITRCRTWRATTAFPTLLYFCGATAIVVDAPRALADGRPNIVFILADDLSWADLGCYGNEVHDTPHLDRLASQGVRFTNGYAPAPICSASRSAILTGKTPARLNFEFVTKDKPGRQDFGTPLQSPPFTLDLPLTEQTMGEALGGGGYTTAFFGKWHVSQHYKGYLGWSPTHGPKQQGFPISDGDFGSHPYAYRKNKSLRDQAVPDGQYPQDSLIDRAVEFIRRDHAQPFFLYLSQYYVHDPVHSRCDWLKDKYAERISGDLPIRFAYGAMVETLDHSTGRVLSALDDAGLANNTLVVFMSDNGGHPNYTANGPLRGSKWNLYEGGIRVPFIARWPGRTKEGGELDSIVHGCDLLPTFCDIADVEPVGSDIDGRSLVALLDGESTAGQRDHPLVWHFPYYHPEKRFAQLGTEIGVDDFATTQTRPHSAIRDGEWKLLHFHEDDRVELYNLANDLSESHNVVDQFPAVATNIRSQLSAYLSNVNARFPTPR